MKYATWEVLIFGTHKRPLAGSSPLMVCLLVLILLLLAGADAPAQPRAKNPATSKYALARIRAQRERARIDEMLVENLKEQREAVFEQSFSLLGEVNVENGLGKAIEAVQQFQSAYEGTNSFKSREYWLALSNALEGVITIVGQSKIAQNDPRFFALDTALKGLNYTLRAVKLHSLTRQLKQLTETRKKLITAISILEHKEQAAASEKPVLQSTESYQVVRTPRNRRNRTKRSRPDEIVFPEVLEASTPQIVVPSGPTFVQPTVSRDSNVCLDRCQQEHDACLKAITSNRDAFLRDKFALDKCSDPYLACWKRCTGFLSKPER